MSPERFYACLDAYGADLRRWPQQDYAAACALAENGPPDLRARMAQAAAFDALLFTDLVEAPDEALILRIAAGAPTRKRPAVAPSAPWWRPGLLWPASVAWAGLAGSLAGVLFMSIALQHMPPSRAGDWMEHGTAFSAAPSDWSEE